MIKGNGSNNKIGQNDNQDFGNDKNKKTKSITKNVTDSRNSNNTSNNISLDNGFCIKQGRKHLLFTRKIKRRLKIWFFS